MLRLETCDVGTGGPEDTPIGPAAAQRNAGLGSIRPLTAASTRFAIDQLCVALAADHAPRARSQVDRLIDGGVSVEEVFDTYIPRVAARLGEMWVEDSLGFVGVTLAMVRLTDIYRSLSPTFLQNRSRRGSGRALFALAPGETHALGVVMAADRFERAGWSVRVELQADAAMLARMARADRYDLIGLSAGSRRMIPIVTETVARLRRAARPGTPILIGGHLGTLEEDLARLTGADAGYASAGLALAEHEDADGRG